MEQYNKNNLKFEITKTGWKKMTLLEQKQIKKFLNNLFPTLKNPRNFEYIFIEGSKKINGFSCRVYVYNKYQFFQLFTYFLYFIQGKSPKAIDKKSRGFKINDYTINEYYSGEKRK